MTQRTELGPLRALPTVRQARIERGMRLGLAQCAQLTPDSVWDRDFGSGCASRVAMMQSADHRECDELPPSIVDRVSPGNRILSCRKQEWLAICRCPFGGQP